MHPMDIPETPSVMQQKLRDAWASFHATKPTLTGSRIQAMLRIQHLQRELRASLKHWIRSAT